MSRDDDTRLRLAHADRAITTTEGGDPASPTFVGRVLTATPLIGHFLRVQPVLITGTETEGGAGTRTDQGDVVLVEAWCDRVPMTGDMVHCWHTGYRWVTCGDRHAPPCHWSAAVRIAAECVPVVQAGRYLGGLPGATIVYTRPDGSTLTHILGPSQWSDSPESDPMPGSWSAVVHSPSACFGDITVTFEVEECRSQTVDVALPLARRTLDYSDDFGSGTATLTRLPYPYPTSTATVCGWVLSYTYSTTGLQPMICDSYGYACIPKTGQPISITVTIHVRPLYYDATAAGLAMQAWFQDRAGFGWPDCDASLSIPPTAQLIDDGFTDAECLFPHGAFQQFTNGSMTRIFTVPCAAPAATVPYQTGDETSSVPCKTFYCSSGTGLVFRTGTIDADIPASATVSLST